MKKCLTPECKNEIEVRNYCQSCRSRKSKQKNILKYLWFNLKGNAKRRGKDFTLTYDQFVQFCKETNYDNLRGKTALSFSIDRIDPCRGYHFDNIRAITLSDNSKLANGKDVDFGPYLTKVNEPPPF